MVQGSLGRREANLATHPAPISTIQENPTGSPVNCEPERRCTLIRNALIASLPQPGTESSEAILAVMYTIAQRLQMQRGKLQMRKSGVQGLGTTQWHPLKNPSQSRSETTYL